MVLLPDNQARQEMQVAEAGQGEIVIARPQMEYLLVLANRGTRGSLETTVSKEIIRMSIRERMAAIRNQYGHALPASTVNINHI
jgi:hypothetical protein